MNQIKRRDFAIIRKLIVKNVKCLHSKCSTSTSIYEEVWMRVENSSREIFFLLRDEKFGAVQNFNKIKCTNEVHATIVNYASLIKPKNLNKF